MLTTANSLEYSQTLVGIVEKDEVIGGSGSNGTDKNLSKSQKPKNSIVLFSISFNTKDTRVLISKANTAFTQLR